MLCPCLAIARCLGQARPYRLFPFLQSCWTNDPQGGAPTLRTPDGPGSQGSASLLTVSSSMASFPRTKTLICPTDRSLRPNSGTEREGAKRGILRLAIHEITRKGLHRYGDAKKGLKGLKRRPAPFAACGAKSGRSWRGICKVPGSVEGARTQDLCPSMHPSRR